MATIAKLSAPGIYAPGGYAHVMKVTGAQTLVFLAGQLAYDASGAVAHRGDFAGQARAVFGAVKAHVEAAGGRLEDIVKLTSYVTDLRYRPDFRTVRAEFFGEAGPASTMVQVSGLSHPEHLIEIDAVAAF